jgi:hypothetical protein
MDIVEKHFINEFLAVAEDKVPNVRIMMARVIHKNIFKRSKDIASNFLKN